MFSRGNSGAISHAGTKAKVKYLIIHLTACRDLPAADSTGLSDPYVCFKLQSMNKVLRSTTRHKSLSPIWNEYFKYKLPTTSVEGETLEITVWDNDVWRRDTTIGHATIDLSPLQSAGPGGLTKWFTLEATTPNAAIQLELVLSDTKVNSAIEEKKSGNYNKYKVHFNGIAGSLKAKVSEGDRVFSKFPTYEVELFLINDVFGSTRQPWNAKYPKANQIYGNTTSAALIRNGIQLQHKHLYKDGVMNRVHQGELQSGEQLLNLINFGIRSGKRKIYTYVIVENSFRFSETGAAFFDDFMSKHAMHSNCAQAVVYAGEFHVGVMDNDGKAKLIIDNNSGTFAPDINLLPKLAELFRKNFSSLDVEALDFNDPKLKQYVTELKAADEPIST